MGINMSAAFYITALEAARAALWAAVMGGADFWLN